MNETILSVLQSDDELNRVVLVHRQAFGTSELVLRRESFSEDVGWFEQSSIGLSPDQVGQLKQSLAVLPGGTTTGPARRGPAPGRKSGSRAFAASHLSVVSHAG